MNAITGSISTIPTTYIQSYSPPPQHNMDNNNNNKEENSIPVAAGFEMVDYMQPQLSFADVMQFADFGPKLALTRSKINHPNEDDDYWPHDDDGGGPSSTLPLPGPHDEAGANSSVGFGGGPVAVEGMKSGSRRKRARAMKTTEEVESQRMTHIAVERNRRRQMNEHLRVLRSLMPGSYVQRGDQASIIGGAIEFVRELEQLLQCLESQKRRRLFGTNDPPRSITDAPPPPIHPPQLLQQHSFLPPLPGIPLPPAPVDVVDPTGGGVREDAAENKSCLADVEVRLAGADAMIKILSRRRPGQLVKIVAALEDLQMAILHTNITTIEQTVLYSFNVKIAGETACTAEDVASSVQQIISFIDTSTI